MESTEREREREGPFSIHPSLIILSPSLFPHHHPPSQAGDELDIV
jgi:hypothetical protein